ncbi:hypothetical protein, partial [Cellulomonas septica]
LLRGGADLAAPVHADGPWADAWSQRTSAEATDRWTGTDDGTARSTTWSRDADAFAPSFTTGPVDADVLAWAWGHLTGQSSSQD